MYDNAVLNPLNYGTAEREISPTPDLPQTNILAISDLTEEAGYIHNVATIWHSDTDEVHLKLLMGEWRSKTTDLVRNDISSLLDQLGELGFAWRDVARMVGVSTPAVQKWRKVGKSTGENRTNVAAVLAACEIITSHYCVSDIASWFESPVVIDYPITPIDLYSAKAISLVLQLASGKADPEMILTTFNPNWRESFRREFEVFRVDGELALRPREH